jgi:mannose-6-phosphate isomerase-like protein (cupin superfamily)
VALFKDLRGFSSGFADAHVPNTKRTLLNVIGYAKPKEGFRSPVGADASKSAAIEISEGFNLAYVRCKPGHGPLMHNHDTNETFVPITGRWRCSWNEQDVQSVDVGPLDTVSFPPGVARRFENVTFDEPDQEHILMVIVAGDAPGVESTVGSEQLIAKHNELAKAG